MCYSNNIITYRLTNSYFSPHLFYSNNICLISLCLLYICVITALHDAYFGITKLDKKNQCIRGKTGAEIIVKEIKQYQEKWLQHIQRMDTNRIPEQALQYKTKGRRHIGRPRNRWRDQFHFEDTRNRNQT
jgi:hypothetical protein